MEQLPGNSHRSQTQASQPAEEPKKIEKIVKGEVTTRKKPFLRRLGDNLMVNRADVVGAAVFWEVLLPAAKNTFVDAVNTYANRLVGTDISGRSHGSLVGQVLIADGERGALSEQEAHGRIDRPALEVDAIRIAHDAGDRGRALRAARAALPLSPRDANSGRRARGHARRRARDGRAIGAREP